MTAPVARTAPKEPNRSLTSPMERQLVLEALKRAQDIAAQRWHRVNFDLYRCLREAWEANGSDNPVPFTQLTRSCRALVPDGNLCRWDDADERRRADVVDLLGRAARSVILRAVA
jgi:hypothetical protein